MRTFATLSTLVFILLLSGCKSGPSLVGRWDTTIKGFPAKVDLRDGGQLSGHLEAAGMGTGDVVGTYELNGKEFSLAIDRLTLKPEKGFESLIRSQEKEITSEFTKPRTGTIEWKNDNQFSFIDRESKETIAFTRETTTK